MHIFSDNPVYNLSDDIFGFSRYVTSVKNALVGAKDLPLCIGIFGDWGTGKTSFMRILQHEIESDRNHKTIWFNPWKYDRKEELWHAFLQTIIGAMAADAHLKPETRQKAERLLVSLTWLTLKKVINAATFNVVSDDDFDGVLEAVTKRDGKYYAHMNSFEHDFAEILNQYIGKGRLAIFVDDLDRCLPENAITVLESLKLFFSDARCIFVLGMDHDVVRVGIGAKYGGNLSGREYLDKIIQIPFFLPPAPFDELRRYIETHSQGALYTDQVWDVVKISMGGNPRKSKRFINTYLLLLEFLQDGSYSATRELKDLSVDRIRYILAALLAFQVAFPDFYNHLRRKPGDWHDVEARIAAAKGGTALLENGSLSQTLTEHLKNPDLLHFLTQLAPTSEYSFPPAPSDDVVKTLLQVTNLVYRK